MSSSNPDSGNGAERPLHENDRSHVQPASDDSVMEQVLRETLLSETEGGLSTAEMNALIEVARRHPNSPICLEPIATELVSTLLNLRFGSLMKAEKLGQDASRRIASTLIEDPDEQIFLQRFWDRLREAVA